MKIYLAVSITNFHNPALVKNIFDYLDSRGHQVLDKHVAHQEHMTVFAQICGRDLYAHSPAEVANIVRDQDLEWVEECDLFIGLFFGGSDGRGAEFEHLRLLLELKRNGQLVGREIRCKKIVCIFPKDKQSRVIFGISDEERQLVDQFLVKEENDCFGLLKIVIPKYEKMFKSQKRRKLDAKLQ